MKEIAMNKTPHVFHRLLFAFKPLTFWTVAAAALTASLIATNLAQAAKPESVSVAHPPAVLAHDGGLIDHSPLANTSLLPEPNASLLHSDPNAYVPVTYGR